MTETSFSFFAILFAMLGAGGSGDLLSFLPTEDYWAQQGVNEIRVADMKPYLTLDADGEEPPDITGLIDQLGAADYQQRQQAEQRILAHGAAVRPQVKAAAEFPDPQIAHTAERLLGELKTEGVAREVRRLMAIRALGELGDDAALDALRPLTDHDAPFVAEYAQQAIARIQGEPYGHPEATDAAMQHDLLALPEGLTMVGQLRNRFEPVTLVDLIRGNPMVAMRRKTRMVERFIDLAHQIGNLRLDGATLGMIGHPERDGYGIGLLRGPYDPAAIKALMTKQGTKAETLAGKTVFHLHPDMRMVLLDDQRVLWLIGERGPNLPVESMIAAATTGEGGLTGDEAMLTRMEKLDRQGADVWAIMDVLPEMRRVPGVPVLDKLDRLSMVVRTVQPDREAPADADGQDDVEPQTAIEITGRADDAESAAAAVEQMNGLIQMALKEMGQDMARREALQPFMQPYVELLENIDITRAEDTATLRTHMPTVSPAQMVSHMMSFFFMRL